jgi:hypothetical protein
MADDIVANASIPPMGSLFKAAQMIVFGMVVLKLRPLRASTTSVSARSQGVVAMDVTYYVALPFVMADDGVAPGETVECTSANAAVMRAEALSRKPGCAGALAFSRTGDPATGEFGDATLIRKFGDVPDDLSAL